MAAHPKTILVVDDDTDTVEWLSVMLKAVHFGVVSARNGAEALIQARKHIPHAIVLDVGLPIVDGFRVSRELRAELSETLIIGHSGYCEFKYYRAAQSAGMDYYLSKPIESEILLACVAPDLYLNVLRSEVQVAADDLYDKNLVVSRAKALSKRAGHAVARARTQSKDKSIVRPVSTETTTV
jgi:DNA-binding response OmpR family regulator